MLFAQNPQPFARECLTPDITLVYPQMANIANVQGDVVSHLRIEPDGVARILDIKGNAPQFLVAGATEVISTIRYPTECAGREMDLILSYRKKYPIGPLGSGTSTRLGPNHFQVLASEWATDQQVVSTELHKSSFWHKLFRRRSQAPQ
jgi:hypothetical protein